MVDLVKVRKKAKEKAAEKAESARKAEGKKQKAEARSEESTTPTKTSAARQTGDAETLRAGEPKTSQPKTSQPAERAPSVSSRAPQSARAPVNDGSVGTGSFAVSAAQDDTGIGTAARRPGDPATPDKKEVAAPEPAANRIARFLAGAGQRRQTGKEKEAEPAKPQIELLTFELSGEQYAIDIEHLVEIVTPRPVTRVPNADSSIVGILSLRGMIVTLVDVRARLRHRAAEATGPDVRIIVTEYDGENTGFVVDRVIRVVKADAEEIDPHPVVHTSEQDESVRGVFRVDGALTILLDLEKLLGVVRNGTYV